MSRLHYARKKLQHALREVSPFGRGPSADEGLEMDEDVPEERPESLAAEVRGE
jgi:hypothetical protein